MLKKLGLTAICSVAVASAAHAGVLGDTINGSYEATFFNKRVDLGTSTIGSAGSDYSAPGVVLHVTDTNIEASFSDDLVYSSNGFVGVIFSNLTGNFPFAYRLASTTLDTVTNDRISTQGATLRINLAGLDVETTDSFMLAAAPLAAVPEPDTYAMLVAGMGLVGAVLRRRRSLPAPSDRPGGHPLPA